MEAFFLYKYNSNLHQRLYFAFEETMATCWQGHRSGAIEDKMQSLSLHHKWLESSSVCKSQAYCCTQTSADYIVLIVFCCLGYLIIQCKRCEWLGSSRLPIVFMVVHISHIIILCKWLRSSSSRLGPPILQGLLLTDEQEQGGGASRCHPRA